MKEVKRNKSETFESFLRRFNKILIQSGKLIQARKIRYHQVAVNKNKSKRLALRKKNIVEKNDYLRKIGKLPEEEMRKRR